MNLSTPLAYLLDIIPNFGESEEESADLAERSAEADLLERASAGGDGALSIDASQSPEQEVREPR